MFKFIKRLRENAKKKEEELEARRMTGELSDEELDKIQVVGHPLPCGEDVLIQYDPKTGTFRCKP